MSEEEHAGLYIHVPFCRTKCRYCDFYSLTSLSRIPRWLKALQKEIMLYEGRLEAFDSLYLGGGTPTLLDQGDLAALMEGLFDHYAFSPDTEITLEANPDDLSPERPGQIRSLGFNRISLGVQSFDDGELALLGRRHTARQAERVVDEIRSGGFSNLGIDLMYGIPGQTLDGWIRTLNRGLAFQPEHLSCYQLTIAKGTPFARMQEQGTFLPLGEEMERAFFLATAEHLEKNGYTQYEISNFARNGLYTSRHNSKYWRHIPYLGLGPSAHSFHHGLRWWNVKSLRDYCTILEGAKAPVAGSENLTPEQLHLEALVLGFRTASGVDRRLLTRQPGSEKILGDLETSGLLTSVGERVVPTREGFLVADGLPLLFSG